jgi:transcriptional regulator with XRE-family HTH domain
MPLSKEVGEAVKWLRTRRRWPQKRLASQAEVTKSMLSSYETGRQSPNLDTLEKILRALDADFCDLYCAMEIARGRPGTAHPLSPHFKDDAPPKRGAVEAAPHAVPDFEHGLSQLLAGLEALVRVGFGDRKPR